MEEIFATHGVAMRARRRQRLVMGSKRSDVIYLLKSGLLVLSANGSGDRRQLLAILYPGDVFSMALVPPLDGVGVVAMTDCELVRMRPSALEDSPRELRELDAFMGQRTAELHARSILHIARLASLSSESRVAAFILELALRTGQVVNDTVTCDLPLSRSDIADYLSLNADTLSRIMTRLKSRGAVATVGRSRAIVKSVKRLSKEVPICAATLALHGQVGSSG
jgi:CRP/FNR family transcriptional regulator, anaerobic regulatory protein